MNTLFLEIIKDKEIANQLKEKVKDVINSKEFNDNLLQAMKSAMKENLEDWLDNLGYGLYENLEKALTSQIKKNFVLSLIPKDKG